MGRFKASADNYEILLDNQTWGAAFLRAVGREADARRALSYARWNLITSSSDGNVYGFDGAGPFSVWTDGTLHYVAEGGKDSQYYWEQMISLQASNPNLDGSMPGSPDPLNPPNLSDTSFSAYKVWLSKWHGIAPTAWLYFAGTGSPFIPLPPAPPVPARNYYTTCTVPLTWNRVTWATEYEIQVDSTPAFNLPLDYTATVLANTLSVNVSVTSDGAYYWRVRAKNGSTVSAWSVVDTFIIDPLK